MVASSPELASQLSAILQRQCNLIHLGQFYLALSHEHWDLLCKSLTA